MDDNYCAPLAAILRKAQGCIDRDTDELIDVGGEVSKLRRICDSQRATISRLRAELAECIVALEKIANPISAMKRALPVGATLNGAMATTLSNDPNYLKEIAKAALAARKGEGEV